MINNLVKNKHIKYFANILLLIIFSSTPAQAGFKESLSEYMALQHDEGLLSGLITSYQKIKLWDPSESVNLIYKTNETKDWVAIQSFQDHYTVINNQFIGASYSDLKDSEIKTQIEAIIVSCRESLGSVSRGSNSKEYWEKEKASAMSILERCTEQLIAIRDGIQKRLIALKEELKSNPDAQSLIELAQQRAELLEQQEALKTSLAQTEKKLSSCQSSYDFLNSQCKSMTAVLSNRRQELQKVYKESLDLAVLEFTAKAQAERVNKKWLVYTLDLMPEELRSDFQTSLTNILANIIKQSISADKTELPYMKILIEIGAYRPNLSFDNYHPSLDLSITLFAEGMSVPMLKEINNLEIKRTGEIKTNLENKSRPSYETLYNFLKLNLPKIITQAKQAEILNRQIQADAKTRCQARSLEIFNHDQESHRGELINLMD